MSQFEKKLSPDYYRLYPRPNLILLYKEPRAQYNRVRNLRPRLTSTSNTLSRNSAMKMKRALNWLVASADTKKVYEKKYKGLVDWRVNFITLTIPAQGDTTDKQCKRLMNEFFKWARYNHGMTNYVWRAEAQARGVIHFHIVSDCYIHYTNVRFTWNKLLQKAGLLNGHEAPNSTDIHAVLEKEVKNVKAYIVDYMIKKDTNADGTTKRSINGRLWGCSKALSVAGKNYQQLDEHEAEIVHKAFVKAEWEVKQIENTNCYIYMPRRNQNPYRLLDRSEDIYKIYHAELKAIRSQSVQLEMFERSAMMEAQKNASYKEKFSTAII